MKRLLPVLLLLLALGVPATAAEPVAQTFNAPIDRVWTTTEAVLKQLGWDIDKKDRSIGMITTESRRLEGEDYGVYAKGLRHRLTLHVKAASENRTTVTIERDTFRRERILWIDKDESVAAAASDKKGDVERSILAAIARALVNRPRILLADEPTGNLDADHGEEIVRLLRDLNRQERLTIIMVTHNLEIASATDRVVRLVKGRVEGADGLVFSFRGRGPAVHDAGWRRAQ